MRRHGEFSTELLDVSELPLAELLSLQHDDLTNTVETVLKQVVRPRANLGGGGPPGRAD
jgi:hypothetical protein